jgi:hypothetical protein
VEPADGWLSHSGKGVEQVPEYHTQTTSLYERTYFPHWQAPTFIYYIRNTNVGWLLTSFFLDNRLFWFLNFFHSRTKIVLTFFEKTFIPCLVLYFYFSCRSTGSFTIDS